MTREPATSILSDLPRLLLVAVVLPVVIVVADRAAVELAKSVIAVRALLPVLFVAQVGLLAACAGRFIANVWLRCLVLAWALAMVDAVALTSMFYGRGTESRCLMFALVSGQIGLLTVWGIMSRLPWQVRIPVYAGALLSLVVILMRSQDATGWWRSEVEIWAIILAMQSGAMVGICSLLRFGGYRLMPAAIAAEPAVAAELEHFQFSIKHVIFWMTAICPTLALAKGVDWFLLDSKELLSTAELALAMALVSWVAMLCALGSSPFVVRVLLLSIVPPMIGYVLLLVTSSWMLMWGSSRSAWILMQYRGFGVGWVVWCALAAWFLAAQLLVFRSAGCTITRSRTSSTNAPKPSST